MSPAESRSFLSPTFAPNLFLNKVLFCPCTCTDHGVAELTICSAQMKAFIYLGGNVCICGSNETHTRALAEDIASVREGSRTLALGGLDVRNIENAMTAAQICVKELGRIDFVIWGSSAPVIQSIGHFDTQVDRELLGAYNTVKGTLPYLLDALKRVNAGTDESSTITGNMEPPSGKIIFVCGTNQNSSLSAEIYAAAVNSGVRSLAESLAADLGPLGLTSNVIAPGNIKTSFTMDKSILQDANIAQKDRPDETLGSVRDVSDATIFLFSQASKFINGSTVVVDGGALLPARQGESSGHWNRLLGEM